MSDHLRFTRRRPDQAYVSENLWLPKAKINVPSLKKSLELYPAASGNYPKAAVRLWKETDNHLIVPRYFIQPEKYKQWGFPFVDLRPLRFPKTKVKHTVVPRDDSQAAAIDALTKAEKGILNLACGKGKSTIALAAAANVGTPTIIVVNNRSLMSQWRDMIGKHWDYHGIIGTVQQKEFDWQHPITIAMIHTLAQKAEEWPADFRRYFGLVIFDEVHHLSAPTFIRTADLFFGRRWGLTATATRADGLEVAIHYHIGKTIYSDLEQVLIPDCYFVYTGVAPGSEQEARNAYCDRSGQENISMLRGWLGMHSRRNELILREIRRARKAGRKILAITHSLGHAEILHQKYQGSGLCVGRMDPHKRLQMIKEKAVTFATARIAGEALDAPSLDTLFILTPFGDHNAMQQSLGRIQRTFPGKKKPMVVIFEDNIPYCHGLCGKLRKFLRQNGYPTKRLRSIA